MERGDKDCGALLLKATDNKLTITLYDRDGNTIDEVIVISKKSISRNLMQNK